MRNGSSADRRRPVVLLAALLLLGSLAGPVAARSSAPARARAATRSSEITRAGVPVDAAVADFNGDRHLDVIETLAEGGFAVRWGTKKNEYADPTVLQVTGVSANRVVAADVTADGVADVIAYTVGGTTLWVLPSDGRGGFQSLRVTTVPQGIRAIATGDFDRDGGVDIAVASQTTSEIVLLSNRTDRSGFERSAFPVSAKARSIATIKLDADGRPDLVVGLSTNAVVALHNEQGRFSTVSTRSLGFTPDLLATFDLNKDGWADAIAASEHGSVASFERTPGGISAPVESVLSAPLTKIDVGYIDGDLIPDVLGVGAQISMVYAGLGEGRFASPRKAASATDVMSAIVLSDSGTLQSKFLISRPSGVSVESIAGSADKLAATITVTNTGDEGYVGGAACGGGMGMMTPGYAAAPGNSLRDAVLQADTSAGPDVIMFDLSVGGTIDDGVGGFSNSTLTFHIFLFEPITLNDDGTEIQGETAADTNPFGPDVVIEPYNRLGFYNAYADVDAASIDLLPDRGLYPLPYVAFIVLGSSCSFSGLIISGNNVGNFIPYRVPSCSDGTVFADVVPSLPTQFPIAAIQFYGSSNTVAGCYIGTNSRGVGNASPQAIAQDSAAVLLVGSGNTVGGTDVADRNIIVSGNEGVRVNPIAGFGSATGNKIIGNIIGSDGTVGGVPGGANPARGVFIFGAPDTTIDSNVIGNSALSGILITNAASGTTISNNRIGAARLGDTQVNANSDGGVVVNGSSGTTIGPANVISGNSGFDPANSGGVVLTGSSVSTSDTVVSGNTISMNATNGVAVVFGDDNTIGPNNTITGNNRGVAVAKGNGNVITKNSITTNSLLGIDLVAVGDPNTGITPNDAGDADTGPNDLLNFPVFTGSTVSGTSVVVTGTAPTGALVEIFNSDNTHPNGEGKTFLISTTAANGTFTATLPVTLPLQETLILTATATTGSGTSEFGPNFTLNQRIAVTPTSLTFPVTAVGGTTSQTVQICNNGVSNLNISGITVTGPAGVFGVTGDAVDGIVLAPGACTTVTVTFSPVTESNFTGTLVIASDDPGGDVTVQLGGSSQTGSITLSVGTLTIAKTPVGGTRTGTITVNNPTSVPVTVTRIDFLRREPANVSFDDRTDPFFTASPATFTIPANGSQAVQILFSPETPPVTPDTSVKDGFNLPDPSFQTPKKLLTDITFVVSDTLNISATAIVKAKVVPTPKIIGISAPDFVDELDLGLDVFDPDNNITTATFIFRNEDKTEIFRIANSPGVDKATAKFPNGLGMPLVFVFQNLAQYHDVLRFLDCTVTDADGNVSNTARLIIVPRDTPTKTGQTFSIVRADGLPMSPFVRSLDTTLPTIRLAPRK